MTTYTLNKYLGGTQTFSVGQLETVLTHMAASVQNEAHGQGVVYMRGSPGLLVADPASPIVRTLMHTYTAQPSLEFTPPIAFMSGNTAVSLTDALSASGALIPQGYAIEDVLPAFSMFFYSGENPFEGPPGQQGPPPTPEEVANSVTSYLTSQDGTSTLTPLISSSTTAWLTDNQGSLVSTVPGPQGSQGIQGEQGEQGESIIGPSGPPGIGEAGPRGASVSSASVSGSSVIFTMSDGSSVTVPLGSIIDSSVATYLADNPPSGASIQAITVNPAGLLTIVMSDSTTFSTDLTTYVLPAPILSASLTDSTLLLNTSSGPVTADLSSLAMPTLEQYTDAAASQALAAGAMYYDPTGVVKIVLAGPPPLTPLSLTNILSSGNPAMVNTYADNTFTFNTTNQYGSWGLSSACLSSIGFNWALPWMIVLKVKSSGENLRSIYAIDPIGNWSNSDGMYTEGQANEQTPFVYLRNGLQTGRMDGFGMFNTPTYNIPVDTAISSVNGCYVVYSWDGTYAKIEFFNNTGSLLYSSQIARAMANQVTPIAFYSDIDTFQFPQGMYFSQSYQDFSVWSSSFA